jgi:N-acetyl-anhydromuramyl-L-alanine amidase AmpD
MAMYWRAEPHLIKHNFSTTAIRPPRGLVVHVTDGALSLQSLFSFFNMKEQKLRDGSRTKSSAHFGVAKNGTIWQFVDTEHQAFAQRAGAPSWISVENCGIIGQELTRAQIESVGNILVWLNSVYPTIPVRLAKTVGDHGLAFHSMDPSWTRDSRCPGKKVISQLPEIVDFALAGY